MDIDRDYDKILLGLNRAEEAQNALLKCAKMLDVEADAAAAELKDEVGKKDIQALKDLSSAIVNAVNPGVERIRELIIKAKKEKEHFDILRDER